MILSCRPNASSSRGILLESASCPHQLTDVVFVLARRKENITPPINFTAYKAWLSGGPSESNPAEAVSEQSNEPSTGTTVATTESSALPEPAYPTSFAHIVELITTGQPIPGIQQIPDTVLEGHDIASERPRRRKPWEKDVEETVPAQDEMTSHAA